MQRLLGLGLLLAATTGACAGFEQNSSILAPSTASSSTPSAPASSVPSMLGTWSSPLAGITASSCTGFSWQVTTQTSNAVAGTFSATCANGIGASGTASGQVSGSNVPYTVTGTATV